MQTPKLRSVEKYKPPYGLNKFSADFAVKLGREIVYLLATRGTPRLEGSDWEEMFARIIGATWKPSNIGLDDVVLHQTAWGAKTVKNKKPSQAFKVRLISGRNSTIFSFDDEEIRKADPNQLGGKILSIWNKRVTDLFKNYKHCRTVVLLKSDDLLEVGIFEFETAVYSEDQFHWQWNENHNLEGYFKENDEHKFTWQPHGSQFTIIEDVPKDRLAIRIKKPPLIDRETVLTSLKFDASWVEILPEASPALKNRKGVNPKH